MTEQPTLLHFAAEAHRRKWAFEKYDSAAFSVLDCIGNELRAAYDAAQGAAETPDAESPAPVPAERPAAALWPPRGEWRQLRKSVSLPPGALDAARALRYGEPFDTYTWDYVAEAALLAAAPLIAANAQACAGAAEAKLAAIEALCRHQRVSAPESVRTPTVAVVRILAIIGSDEKGPGNG